MNAAEEETLESLKKWWDENGKQLIATVVVVALGFGGYNFWESQQVATQGEASDLYEEILELSLLDPGEEIAADDASEIILLCERLRAEYGQTAFAAAQHVAADDLAAAEEALQWVIDNPGGGLFSEPDEGLLLTANLRLGRVILAQGDAQRALDLVNGVDPKTFEAGFSELRGDIYLALDREADARDAFLAAQEAGSQSEALRMKLDNLASL
jgi:predicted negative regulator of RcsB-dependent stress response